MNLEQYIPKKAIIQMPARWMEIESIQGEYNWPHQLDINTMICSQNVTILGTRTCPEWARLWPEHIGSPPQECYYPDYAELIIRLILRYGCDAVEIWNEPDCRPSEAGASQYWLGTWVGNDETHYQGGQRYGQFLAAIYKHIKAEFEDVRIIAGALIGNETSLEFIRGAVDADLHADAVSFHRYLYQGGEFMPTYTFAEQLQEITNLSVILSETSVRGAADTEELRQYQADYLNWLAETQYQSPLGLALWYTLEHPWQNTALLRDKQPTSAWDAWAEAMV